MTFDAGDKFTSSITVPLRAPTVSKITFAISSGSIAFSGELPGSKSRSLKNALLTMPGLIRQTLRPDDPTSSLKD